MEKILNFIKERMLEIAGLAAVVIGISLFSILIFNYTPNNPTLISQMIAKFFGYLDTQQALQILYCKHLV